MTTAIMAVGLLSAALDIGAAVLTSLVRKSLIDALDGGPDDDSCKLIMTTLRPEEFEAKFKDPAVAKHVRRDLRRGVPRADGDAYAGRIGLQALSAHDLAFKHLLRAIRAVGRVAAFVPGSSERFARMGHAYWESFTSAADLEAPATKAAFPYAIAS